MDKCNVSKYSISHPVCIIYWILHTVLSIIVP
jgi:hypothetical protein